MMQLSITHSAKQMTLTRILTKSTIILAVIRIPKIFNNLKKTVSIVSIITKKLSKSKHSKTVANIHYITFRISLVNITADLRLNSQD